MSRSSQWFGRGLLFAAVLFVLAVVFPRPSPGNTGPVEPKADVTHHESYTETIPGSQVRFDMVAIPGGSFLIGSPDGEAGQGADEGPQHPVLLRPFWMGRT